MLVRRFNNKKKKNHGSCCHLPGPYLPGSREWVECIPKSAVSDPPFPLLMLTLFIEVSPLVVLSWLCSRCKCFLWLATLALFMGEPERSKHNWMRQKIPLTVTWLRSITGHQYTTCFTTTKQGAETIPSIYNKSVHTVGQWQRSQSVSYILLNISIVNNSKI